MKKELSKIIKELREVIDENNLVITHDNLFIQSCMFLRGEYANQSKSNSKPKTPQSNSDLPTDKQINMMNKLKIPTDNVTKKEAMKLIKEKIDSNKKKSDEYYDY